MDILQLDISDQEEPPKTEFKQATFGWRFRGIMDAAEEHAHGECDIYCRYCKRWPMSECACPQCGRSLDTEPGGDAVRYSDFHKYMTDYGEGTGWCETVQCSRCGYITEYSNGNL